MKIEKKSQNPFFIHHPDQVNDVVVRGDHFLQHLLIYVGHVKATHADVRFWKAALKYKGHYPNPKN